jgi:hypothetical protein
MEKATVRVKELVQVVCTIHDIDIDKYFIEVQFSSVDGELKRITLPRGLRGPTALEKLLNEGASIPHGATKELLEVLSAEPGPIKKVTGHTGWHGPSFVLPDMTIGPDAETLGYRQQLLPAHVQ